MASGRKQYVIAVCGRKNSGKTTLIERMIRELSERGLKTAVIKHDGHDFSCDIPGTDSDRFMEAGAAGAAVYSSSQMFVRKRISGAEQWDPGSPGAAGAFGMCLLPYFPDADVVIIEGMKSSPVRKIEVVRRGVGTAPVSEPEGRVLIVTDLPKESFQEPAAGFEEMERILGAVLEPGSADAETTAENGSADAEDAGEARNE